ncbi:MAG: hypothetical protein M3323_12750 [Actinomycetota bacterium]|nr:hypothetical protein [Actinomycetota bacterium]
MDRSELKPAPDAAAAAGTARPRRGKRRDGKRRNRSWKQWRRAWGEWVRRVGLWMLLFGVVVVVLVPSVALSDGARLFLLKLLAAAVMSFLPGWIYLQFIRNKGESLYDEYVLNLFRLHIDDYRNLPAPPEHTSYYRPWKRQHAKLRTKTKDNLYRRKFEAIYGRSAVSTFDKIYDRRKLRDKTETFSPVLLATLLLCLGWVLVLQPEPLDLFGEFELSGAPELPYETLQFGFLGSYFFILQDLLRRYFREDLRTAAYISASARVVFVAVMITAVDVVWESTVGSKQVFAFLIGMFPQIGLQALRAAVAVPLRRGIPSLETAHPLSDLDGLNYWYEARLAEEGIEDIQNLTSANLVDLLLRSRVPISRLIDWIDQGFLHLHLPVAEESKDDPWQRLRSIGIRGATDLERAWAKLGNDDGFRSNIAAALGEQDPSRAAARVEAIVTSLAGQVNLWHVRAFKQHEWLHGDAEPDEERPIVLEAHGPQLRSTAGAS